jgi:hypothetical protein
MAFIGNTNTTQSFAPAIDYFNGNGSTVAFTLSRPVASVAQVQVVVNNVQQNPADAYTVSGNTITFTSAPSSGTSNIYVYYTSPITQVVQPSTGTVGKTQLDVYGGTGTGAMTVPTGTTAQRPSNPVVGDTRWNTTLGQQEVFVGFSIWQAVATNTYTVFYMLVAGGGSGGNGAGGGGAGGLLTGNQSATIGTAYTVTIGAGGAAASGSNTTALGLTAIGGGNCVGSSSNGTAGGSGGGGGRDANTGGAGTAGQGNAGGNAGTTCGGGGGGAGAAGGVGSGGSVGGSGGVGLANSISGSSVFYAGGGGAWGASGYGSGGNGGGGTANGTTGNNGTVNTGGGGGAGGSSSGTGGSGIVIISYLGTQRGTGGTVTSSGGYTIHTFTTSGTFTA